MSASSIEERRECAENLRGMSSFKFTPINWPVLMGTLGVGTREDAMLRLADLIDPTPWQNAVEDNHRLLDRFRELEAENARLKAHVGGMANELKDEMR